MLFDKEYFPYVCKGYLLLSLIFLICAGYAYRANARRSNDDPEKRDFHFGAIILAPITWSAFLAAYIMIFVLRAVVYSVSLFVVLAALVFIRKPFLLIWLDKIATKIGNKLLEVNTLLIKAFFGKPIVVSK